MIDPDGYRPNVAIVLMRPDGRVFWARRVRRDGWRLDLTETPEFDHWRWVDFWYPLEHVVNFKRMVYTHALHHLAPAARQVAGAQAIPSPNVDPRRWSRPRGRWRPLAPRSGQGPEPG